MYFSIDWYNKNIATIPDAKSRMERSMVFITSASDFLHEECYRLSEDLLIEARKTNDKATEAFALLYIAGIQKTRGLINEYNENFRIVEELINEAEPGFASAIVCQMIAFDYWTAGQRDLAFQYSIQGFKRTENLGNENEGFGWAGFQLGVFHFDMRDFEISLSHFKKSEAQAETLGLNYQLARTRSGIGSVYIATDKLEEGLAYNKLALEGYRECGHSTAISRALNDMGVINFRMGNSKIAEQYLREALQIREDLFYSPGIITSRIELSKILLAKKEEQEAETLLLSALELGLKTKAKQKVVQCHNLLSELYKQQQNPWKALEHLENSYKVKSEVAGEESTNKIKSLQQKFATERADQETEIHRLKNVELKKAYGEIEEKNKSILDSIHYARRIQKAILASDNLLKKNLTEYFAFYQPKDIVSGDFYWAHEGNNDLFFLAACDCTGHGVPGAFMSLINSAFLNEAVIERGLTQPAEILNEVRKHLVAALNPEGSKEETRDGMDATIIALNKKTNVLSFACANNPLLLLRDNEIQTFLPDKFPVGIYPDYESRPFTHHELQLKKGDLIYLLTDGFGDQFGGPQGKKFKIKNLKNLLLSIHQLPLQDQCVKLSYSHAEWKGQLEQVDDVLIVGLKI
jgi:serine phosphatase RsbU (regulator of sigma subunit)